METKTRSSEELLIMLERKGKKQFSNFIELFCSRQEIPVKEIRSKIPKSTFYNFIIEKLYSINQSLKNLNPELDDFIAPAFCNYNGRVVQTFRKSDNIEIIAEDPNFFYLRVKAVV